MSTIGKFVLRGTLVPKASAVQEFFIEETRLDRSHSRRFWALCLEAEGGASPDALRTDGAKGVHRMT